MLILAIKKSDPSVPECITKYEIISTKIKGGALMPLDKLSLRGLEADFCDFQLLYMENIRDI